MHTTQSMDLEALILSINLLQRLHYGDKMSCKPIFYQLFILSSIFLKFA